MITATQIDAITTPDLPKATVPEEIIKTVIFARSVELIASTPDVRSLVINIGSVWQTAFEIGFAIGRQQTIDETVENTLGCDNAC